MNKHSTLRLSCRSHSMTLVEMMFAVIVASMVFAMLFSMLSRPLGLWHKAMAQWHLTQQGRMLRERMLRGIEYKYGLREAQRSSVMIQPGSTEKVEWIDFDVDDGTFPGTGTVGGNGNENGGGESETVTCRILQNSGHNLAARTTPGSGNPVGILRDTIKCEQLEYTEMNDQLMVDYTLSMEAGGETFKRRNVMWVTLLNP